MQQIFAVCWNVLLSYRADWDELVWVVHHGNEQVEKDNDVDDGEWAEHEESKEPGELLDASQLEVVQVDQPEDGPHESLDRLPQTEKVYQVQGFN